MATPLIRTPLEIAELKLLDIDRGIKDLKEKFESKQSERIISNHVWMQDYMEKAVKQHIPPFRELIMRVRDGHLGNFNSTTNFDIIARHSDEIGKLIDSIILMYKMRASFFDIKLKWQYSIPKINENLMHLKNRFGIMKGQLSRKQFEYEEERWF